MKTKLAKELKVGDKVLRYGACEFGGLVTVQTISAIEIKDRVVHIEYSDTSWTDSTYGDNDVVCDYL